MDNILYGYKYQHKLSCVLESKKDILICDFE